ncbi:hypothetical protein [Anaerorhabdus sp.]|uniref:hypothetical protein n=1 Tax=Anaerorhabdus sp. TaxID=1872524 RepID=UPI002FC648BC
MKLNEKIRNGILIAVGTSFLIFSGSFILEILSSSFSRGFFNYYNLRFNYKLPIFQSFQAVIESVLILLFIFMIGVGWYFFGKLFKIFIKEKPVKPMSKLHFLLILMVLSNLILFGIYNLIISHYSLELVLNFDINFILIYNSFYLLMICLVARFSKIRTKAEPSVFEFLKSYIYHSNKRIKFITILSLSLVLLIFLNLGFLLLGDVTASFTAQYTKFTENNKTYIVITKIDNSNYLCVELIGDTILKNPNYLITSIDKKLLTSLNGYHLKKE